MRAEESRVSGCNHIRLLVLGDRQVGKSAIAVRFLTRRFIVEYRSHIDVTYNQSVSLEGTLVEVEITDVSHKPEENLFPTGKVVEADAFMVAYSIVDRPSFYAAQELLDSIQKAICPSYAPVLLVANKSDLDHLRQVKEEEGRDVAVKFNCCDFQEVSAAEDADGIHHALQGLIRETVQLKIRQSAPRHRKLSAFKMIGSLIGRSPDLPSSSMNERANSFKHVFKKRSV